MGWTSHCDIGLYTGWVMAYSESTLQQTQLLNLTPNGHEGSIWMSGGGIAADSQGYIYLLDANGTFDLALDANGFPTKGDYGNAMVKLSTTGKLAVADYFEMYNTESESNEDLDLGSGGPLLLPDRTNQNGIVHHLIVGAGKDKNIYLADRDNLGKFNPATDPMDSNIYQQLTGAMAGLVYATPAYFNGVLYYAADGDTLKAFPLTNAQLALTPSSQTTIKFPHPGPTPSISANGTQNGIIWALSIQSLQPRRPSRIRSSQSRTRVLQQQPSRQRPRQLRQRKQIHYANNRERQSRRIRPHPARHLDTQPLAKAALPRGDRLGRRVRLHLLRRLETNGPATLKPLPLALDRRRIARPRSHCHRHRGETSYHAAVRRHPALHPTLLGLCHLCLCPTVSPAGLLPSTTPAPAAHQNHCRIRSRSLVRARASAEPHPYPHHPYLGICLRASSSCVIAISIRWP